MSYLKVTPEYIEFIQSNNRAIIGHLFTFKSQTGDLDYFTDMDIDITIDGIIYKSSSLRFSDMPRKLSVGLNVDEQNLKIWAQPTDTLFGSPFLSNAQVGLLDWTLVKKQRAVWKYITGNAAYDVLTNDPFQVFTLFTGYMQEIVSGGSTHVEFKIKSPLVKLDIDMPRNMYQPGCQWVLFSPGCTLNKDDYVVHGTVGTLENNVTVNVTGGIATPTAADGLQNYAKGRILFTSGVNNGLYTTIQTNDAFNLTLTYPLENLPLVGDMFDYYPGCSKSNETCTLKFGNQVNRRGFDKVPPIMVSF